MRTLAPTGLAAGSLQATFVPEAGMLCSSLRHEGEELLGPLGIPFLHPWANRLERDEVEVAGRLIRAGRRTQRDTNGLPIHGLPARPWRVRAASDTLLVARLAFADPAFPFPHTVEQRIDLDATRLRITTTVSDGPAPIAFGFHPYVVLPGVRREDWIVGLPERKHLVAGARLLPTGATIREPAERRPLGRRTFDDGYAELRHPRFTLDGGGRRIEVAFTSGYTHAQIYSPADDDVICFEPMTAPTNALVTGDGLRIRDTFRAAFEIRVG
jgi:galactose mutarotase-like enzyme